MKNYPILPARREGGAGMSLIELMVVIVVVAVLAAITLPAIKGSLAAAQQAKCLSNLKEIGATNLLYSTEHDGGSVAPYGPSASGGTGLYYWNQVLADYLGLKEGLLTMAGIGIFHCTVPASEDEGFSKAQRDSPRYGLSYYPYSPAYNPLAPKPPEGGTYSGNRSSRLPIGSHGGWVFVMCAPNFNNYWGSISSQRHRGGAHYLLYNGAVIWRSFDASEGSVNEAIRKELLRSPVMQ